MELSAGWRHLLCHSALGRQLPRTIQGQVHLACLSSGVTEDSQVGRLCSHEGLQILCAQEAWPGPENALSVTHVLSCFETLGAKEPEGAFACWGPQGLETSSVCRQTSMVRDWWVSPSIQLLAAALGPLWLRLFALPAGSSPTFYLHVHLGRSPVPSSVRPLCPHTDWCVFSYVPL